MAENDTHYNEIPEGVSSSDQFLEMTPASPNPSPNESIGNGSSGTASSSPETAYYDYGLTTPLPDEFEGGPVYPGNSSDSSGSNTDNGDANTPQIPLPNPGEGIPAYPGDGGNNTGNIGIIPPNSGLRPTIPPFSFPSSNLSNSYCQVRFLNASTNTFPVTIYIDGNIYADRSRFGSNTNYEWIRDGFHTITVRRATGIRSILLQQNLPFSAGQKNTVILTDSSSGGLSLVQASDNGCQNLPSGYGCFRFANMSYSGSRFDLLTANGDAVFRGIAFQNISAYKQAMAGTYLFFVSATSSYTFMQELPMLIIGVSGNGTVIGQPVLSFPQTIRSGRNYTTYLIGNTWSDYSLQTITLES